jgi:hypothetical protein
MLLKFPAGGTTWLREEMVYPDKQSHKREVTWKTGKEKYQSDQVNSPCHTCCLRATALACGRPQLHPRP